MIREIKALLESRERRGSTHWQGCETHHIDCAAAYLLRQVEHLIEELDRERKLFPSDGVWLVESEDSGARSMRIAQLGEVPDPIALASIARHSDAIVRAVNRVRPEMGKITRDPPRCICTVSLTYPSASTVAHAIIRELEVAMRDEDSGR